jgi:FtsP/CotA-like multicopper oxidase with cupredoxin domain
MVKTYGIFPARQRPWRGSEIERSETMRKKNQVLILTVLLLMFWVIPIQAEVYVQCPCLLLDANGKPDPTQPNPAYGTFYNLATQNIECTIPGPPVRNIACKFLTAGDGHVTMADGNDIYVFGFDDVTGVPTNQIMNMVNDPVAPGGMRGAETSAPTINVKAGQEFYLSLTNVGMVERPDLVDPHTVHYHGFPNASSVFDGEPMASMAINMGETLTYYYNNVEPGTYMYHCHVEASEHMQMGMLGNLYVRPQQDGTLINGYTQFAYNDCPTYPIITAGCGSTGYDVGYPIEITAMDPEFHHADQTYNETDFAFMTDTYSLLNGRGYPDTINPCGRQTAYPTVPAGWPACTGSDILNSLGVPSQNTPALIMARAGQKILLHFPSLSTVDFHTVTLLGLPMTIIGQGARQYRNFNGTTYYYNTGSITLGGGEAYDILINTAGASPGTYFLYTTNLNYLSNDAEDFGGMMTEIVLTP